MSTPNFKAWLYLTVNVKKRITWKKYKTLSPEFRDNEEVRVFWGGIYKWENRYFEIVPNQTNPKIKELRGKLERQKIKFKTSYTRINGRDVVILECLK